MTGFAKITRDVTGSKQAQESVIAELSSMLLANMDIRKLLDAILRQHRARWFRTTPQRWSFMTTEPTGKLRVAISRAGGDAGASQGEMLLRSG